MRVTFAGDGTYRIEVMNDPDWLLMRVEPFSGLELSGRLEPAQRDRRLVEMETTFAEWVHLSFDGERTDVTATYVRPTDAGPLAQDETRLGTMRLEGRVPEGAGTFSFAYGLIQDPYPLLIRSRPARRTSYAGRRSVNLCPKNWVRYTYWNVGEYETDVFDLGALTPPSRLDVVRTYLHLGFTHILPKGLDHILFVVGIFLLSTRMKPMLAQVTTFTIAHTITLGLTIYGVLSLPSSVVEPLIALSIAYVAIENIVTSTLTPWRIVLVFAFGLLHGMGFAGVLTELGLPRSEFVPALMSFNLGVEGGQIAVIAAMFLALGWARHQHWYRRLAVVPLSASIAAVGIYWTVTRIVT